MFNYLKKEIEDLKASGLYRSLRTVEGPQGPRVRIEGREVILLCSNNYLGLADHPVLKEAAIRATERYGVGSGSSRLVSGSMELHCELEDRIARFKGTESALVFNSGYTANTSVIPALVGRGDTVISDKLNHASIVDGCILSRAEFKRYLHGDMEVLEGLLRDTCAYVMRNKLVVTDSVFSMDGDIAPLPEIRRLAGKYGAMVMIDDAHATGVLGKKGRGGLDHFGIEDSGDFIQMGTLGKALGTHGAYIAGKKELIDYLINRARGFIYSTSLPPSVMASAIAAFDIVESRPGLRDALMENARYIKKGLEFLGFDTMQSETPIIPVMVGVAGKTMEFSRRLLEEGVFVSGIRPPTVPEGGSRLRVTVMATHTKDDLDQAIAAFSRVGRELCLIS